MIRESDNAVAVLMSGGVDSSVAAFLLKQAGCGPVGVTLFLGSTSGMEASEDASRVCSKLQIPHQTLDVRDTFAEQVVEPFKNAYKAALTPNPCVLCNVRIKFGAVRQLIRERLGIATIATGHYAQIVYSGSDVFLSRAACAAKDQSYFLYRLDQSLLSQVVFPLGVMSSKNDVRVVARSQSLPIAEKPESMDLCFLTKGDYRALFGKDSATTRGSVLDMRGNVIAEHEGIHNYTVGQRRGLGFATGTPVYVVRINPSDNTITVGTAAEVSTTQVHAVETNVLQQNALQKGGRLFGKIRSRGEASSCRVAQTTADTLDVVFDTAQFAPTPGQHVVLYDDRGYVVAGGMIAPSKQ